MEKWWLKYSILGHIQVHWVWRQSINSTMSFCARSGKALWEGKFFLDQQSLCIALHNTTAMKGIKT